MSWRDELQNGGIATWRGIPFELDNHTSRFGRRTTRHEYPQRNVPFVEDLGRRTREFSLTGFVQGDDYFARRDALIAAAETPGPGTLVHPYLGTLTVSTEGPVEVTESKGEGRMARFTFAFVETGNLSFPSIALDTADAAIKAAEVVEVAASAQFAEDFDTTTRPGFVGDSAQTEVGLLTTRVRDAVQPFFSAIDDFAELNKLLDAIDADVATLIATPGTLADELVAVFQEITSLDALRTLHALAGIAGPSDAVTPSAIAEQANTEALLRMQVQAALAAAVKVAAGTTFTVFDDAIEVRAELAARIAAEEELAGGHDLFVGLVDLRVELVEFIDQGSQDLPRLRDFSPPAVTPSLVIAWDLYTDALRADEINDRNRVRRPMAITPGTVLRVLTS